MGYEIKYENGIANRGNVSRLKKVMQRAEAGEKITLGFLGGSITQGSLASEPERCYVHRVYEWWCRNFKKAEFTCINAGIGGTTSEFGVARVDSDLLAYEPDFVIVEFSVNDDSTEHFMETYEGLVRRIYTAKTKPAVLLVHNVFYHNGANAQVVHGRVGRHYDLPAVSMQSSIYPEIVAGRIENREITPDDLHPNDAGHELVASVIDYFLDQVRTGAAADSRMESTEETLPAPLTANTYENAVRYRNDNAVPELEGFLADTEPQHHITDCFKLGWTAGKEGDRILFHVRGNNIAVQYRKSVKLPAPVAEAIVDGDRENAVRLDANFDETWGDKLELDTILEHGAAGEHTVEIRIVETHPDDAVLFYLVSVIASGEANRKGDNR
jgi:lysophospholipase L1-like esterase